MTGVNRHAHTGARDLEVGQTHDLAALEAKLLLLVGLIEAIVDQRTGEREHVERDRLHEVRALVDRHRPPVVGELRTIGADLLGLLIKLADTGEPGTRYGLVGRDDHRLESGLVGERLHNRHGDHRGAVGVGDDALGDRVEVGGVDLGHDQRDVVVHAPGTGVVDHDRTGGRDPRGEFFRRGTAGGEERDVEAAVVGRLCVFHRDVLTIPFDGLARRTGGGEQSKRGHGEGALRQERPHHTADLAGGTNDSYVHGGQAIGQRIGLADEISVVRLETSEQFGLGKLTLAAPELE